MKDLEVDFEGRSCSCIAGERVEVSRYLRVDVKSCESCIQIFG